MINLPSSYPRKSGLSWIGRFVRLWVFVCAGMTLAGCVGDRDAPIAADLPTIVSLNPCTDAILAEVADPEQLLAISHYSHDPKATSMPLDEARRFAAIGGTVEEVLALGPDLVVGSSYMPPATRASLQRLDMRVETVGLASTVEASNDQIRQIAKAAGHPERGEALIARIEAALTRAAYDGPPITAVMWQQGGIVPGEGALISDLMRRSGFANHTAAKGFRQADYLPLESMLADPPDIILTAGNSRAQQHSALAGLGNTQRATFDASLLYCGGPTIARAAQRLGEIREQME